MEVQCRRAEGCRRIERTQLFVYARSAFTLKQEAALTLVGCDRNCATHISLSRLPASHPQPAKAQKYVCASSEPAEIMTYQ